MLIRNEPSVSILTKAGELVGFKVRGIPHDQLVADALSSFTKAEQQMQTAIQTIDADVAAEQQLIRDAENRIEVAGNHRSKLDRVLTRLKALTE
jgi:ferritin-like metal-binding protein YciE